MFWGQVPHSNIYKCWNTGPDPIRKYCTQHRATRHPPCARRYGYLAQMVRDDTDYRQHFDYRPDNPVKHGYVAKTADWPYSSLHRWVKRRVYTLDWAAPPAVIEQYCD